MSLLRITHYTLSSALGHGRTAHWTSLRDGQSGLRPARFDTSDIQCYVGEVVGLSKALPTPLSEFDCRNNRLAWLGLQQDGFSDAAEKLRARYGASRVGVFMGTSTAGIHSAELAYRERRAANQSGDMQGMPDWFDYRHTQNLFSVADFVAHALQLAGPLMVISTACSSSAKVFAAAYRSIQMGQCDAAIVGGVDSLCLTTLYGFNSLQLVSSDVCRPADVNRNGISIGEAAGFAIVEKPAADNASVLRFWLLFLLFFGYCRLRYWVTARVAMHITCPRPIHKDAVRQWRCNWRCNARRLKPRRWITLICMAPAHQPTMLPKIKACIHCSALPRHAVPPRALPVTRSVLRASWKRALRCYALSMASCRRA
jgi:hypothetical protein